MGKAPARSGPWHATELTLRWASGLALGVVALALTVLGGVAFDLFWLAAGLAVLIEWLRMTKVEAGALPVLLPAALAVLGLARLAGVPPPGLATLAAGGVALAAALAGARAARLWAALGFLYAAVIVIVPPEVRARAELGLVAVLWMFAVVWSTDVVAYFVGRAVGGPKLWPRVSPKKTWSGGIGGLAAGVAAGLLVALVADARLGVAPASLGSVALLSALASVASQAGDFGESALKRFFDVKDSSRLIPGHGGVMDRLDGFWAVSLLMGLILAASALAGGPIP
jgi:phosphatidate cytidylyltransferase